MSASLWVSFSLALYQRGSLSIQSLPGVCAKTIQHMGGVPGGRKGPGVKGLLPPWTPCVTQVCTWLGPPASPSTGELFLTCISWTCRDFRAMMNKPLCDSQSEEGGGRRPSLNDSLQFLTHTNTVPRELMESDAALNKRSRYCRPGGYSLLENPSFWQMDGWLQWK